MNFDPTDEQRRWRDLARDFAQSAIRPRAEQLDREQRFPYDIVAGMASLGLMGLTLPEEYGGSGGDFVEEYPMTASGKIQKYKLREAAVERYGLQEAAEMETA